MKKTCSVNEKCLSFFPRFSLPARCKFTVLIFKINFLWFWPPERENRFLVFFFKYSTLLAKTNHIRFLILPIPIWCKIWKKSIFQLLPPNARCLLKVALKNTKRRQGILNGARSRYLELFWGPLTNTKEERINQKGTRMVNDGED